MEHLVNKVNNFESMLTRLAENTSSQIAELTSNVNSLATSTNTIAQTLDTFLKAQSQVTPTSSGGNSNNESNGGGTSSAPATPILNGNIIRSSNGVKTRLPDWPRSP